MSPGKCKNAAGTILNACRVCALFRNQVSSIPGTMLRLDP